MYNNVSLYRASARFLNRIRDKDPLRGAAKDHDKWRHNTVQATAKKVVLFCHYPQWFWFLTLVLDSNCLLL